MRRSDQQMLQRAVTLTHPTRLRAQVVASLQSDLEDAGAAWQDIHDRTLQERMHATGIAEYMSKHTHTHTHTPIHSPHAYLA